MENEEQVLETSIQTEVPENVASSSEIKEEVVSEQKAEWKAPTQEEYEKAIKSSASKAKYEILKELNVKSVDDFKAKSEEIEKSIKELDDVKKENTKLKEDLLIKELNISEEYREDFLTLAKAKVTETQDLNSVAKDIVSRNPNWVKISENIKIGNEKAEIKATQTTFMANKYPWLKNN